MIALVGLVMSCKEQVKQHKLDFAYQNVKARNEDLKKKKGKV